MSSDPLRRVAFPAMGTTVEVVLPRRAPVTAEDAVQRLFETREAVLTRFRAESELSRLNAAAGRAVHVGDLLYDSVEAAVAAAHATGGVFDPCLGTQMVAIGYGRPFRPGMRVGMPTEGTAPGGRWRDVVLDPVRRTVTVPRGVAVDLGGIGKGMAVDAAVALLRDLDVACALVSAGGDLAVLGTPPGEAGWEVRLEEVPGRPGIAVREGALATSSTVRRRWAQGGLARHHLIDPRTGEPAWSGLRAVTVAAATCAQAEVASKAALILGAERGGAFLHRLGVAATLVPTLGAASPVNAWPLGRAA